MATSGAQRQQKRIKTRPGLSRMRLATTLRPIDRVGASRRGDERLRFARGEVLRSAQRPRAGG